jgi:hypothetical protein
MLTCPACRSRSLETHKVGSGRLLSVCECGVIVEGGDQYSLHIVMDGRRRVRGAERGVLIGGSAVGNGGG